MTLTSLGGVTNSASVTFTNAKAHISLVNYGRVTGSIDTYQYNLNLANQSNSNLNQYTYSNTNTNTNTDYNPKQEQNKNTWNSGSNRNLVSN